MSERQIVYRDHGGVRRTIVLDDERPHAFSVLTEQNLDQILAGIERDRETMAHDGPNKLVARIPIGVYERAVHEAWDEGDWKRWLNSAEAAPFRIWQGRV